MTCYPTAGGAPIPDLLQTEVEILEEGVLQKIEEFERVLVPVGRPQSVRRDLPSLEAARQAATSPRTRVFVLFLDLKHVSRGAAVSIRKPLAAALDRIIAGDDLIAVMTTGMSASDLTFTRTTTSIESYLGTWWGERDRIILADSVEEAYASCYPGTPSSDDNTQLIAQEMILRRREQQSLDALEELVRHLRTVREERKAVITVSNGWRLFEENQALNRRTNSRTATLRCESDRQALALIDNRARFRTILDEANRANTSFYPVDPRGLTSFDDDIVPTAGVGVNPVLPLVEDQARLRDRSTSLRTMAEETDGLAILQTNQLAAGFDRIANDLSSYYLMGYYSTQKSDGKFHRITVRVKRPGVQVRARRGFFAPAATRTTGTAESRATVASAENAGEARVLQNSLAPLGAFGRAQPLRVQAAVGYTPSGTAAVWLIAEAERVAGVAGGDDWSKGGELDLTLLNRAGEVVATERVALLPGAFGTRVTLKPSVLLTPGEYQLQVRGRSVAGSATSGDGGRVVVPEASGATGAMFARRGVTTGNRQVQTADLRFRRTEQLFVEIPTVSSEVPAARLLDRTGKALGVPVTSAVRDDPDGSRWRTAQLTLSPLAPGDYIIEMATATERTMTAFRVLP